ncbi:unnamed protein product [Echinostoma caproni]|uniref:DNA polymerase epsilon catalytic subunit n=1 Tax=Echinostoma caproni TaxID=27848 RepID=A0A183B0Y4_9TREM|nr:unnamed protein product [Echinostoma caproni]
MSVVSISKVDMQVALVDNLVDGKDVEWGEGEPPLVDDDDDDINAQTGLENRISRLPEPEIDMHWHISRYIPETRGLRTKFQTLLAGYLLTVYNAVRDEHRRIRGLTVFSQLPNETGDSARRSGTHIIGGNQDVDAVASQAENAFTAPLQSDASVSPGVLEFTEKLVRDQLAPELYTLVQRLYRKAGWIDPELASSTSALLKSVGPVTPNLLRDRLERRTQVVSKYLAEKTLRPQMETTDLNRRPDTDVMLPLLPPHPCSESLMFTPLLDFIKSICEVLSLDRSLKRQVTGIRRDLLRLIGVGEFSPEAVWIAPHLVRDEPLSTQDYQDSELPTAHPIRSLLVYLPEVACPVCNFTRDIDVCRDTHLVRMVDTTESAVGHWAWVCPHCRNVYPRSRLEEALVQQLEQIALQHCLQDLQCVKCLSTGGIQETILAKGGSVARCADCSHRLSLTIPVGTAFYKRLDVYRSVGLQFGFPVLEQTAFWMLCGLHTS